ncbi:MAG: alpha-amylase family glycosyl hydrolase [Terracidiphilus sp.]
MVLACAIPGATSVLSAETGPAGKARQTPEWVSRGVIYQIWLRGFTSDGTLSAATKRLAHIAKLGATIVYLSPIYLQDDDTRREFWSPRQIASGCDNPRSPYRIMDYDRIDPEYGTETDLHEFVETAHTLGLKVLMDIVFLDCGPSSNLVDRPGFIKRDEAGKIVTNLYNFPVLNFASPELRDYLIANMTHWVDGFGVDGFRCDVGDGIPLDFWEQARTKLSKLRPDLVMLAEGSRAEDQFYAFDMNYSYPWWNAVYDVVLNGKPASSLQTEWEANANELPSGARLIRFVETHDKAKDYGPADSVFGERAAMLWTIMNFTLDGVPFIYNGQEIGDSSPQSIFCKMPLQWESSHLPTAKKRFVLYQNLCRLRRNERPLSEGLVRWLQSNQPESTLSYVRSTAAEEILTVLNFSNRPVQLVLPHESIFDQILLSEGAKMQRAGEELAIDVQAEGYIVAKRTVGA